MGYQDGKLTIFSNAKEVTKKTKMSKKSFFFTFGTDFHHHRDT